MTKACPMPDLMVVCVEAGLGLDMTFKRVGDEVRPINKDLSEEFRLTNLEIRRTFRMKASRIWPQNGVPEIHNLMTVLVQTSRFGTSLAKALRVTPMPCGSKTPASRRTGGQINGKADLPGPLHLSGNFRRAGRPGGHPDCQGAFPGPFGTG
jgi:hypothetical protein